MDGVWCGGLVGPDIIPKVPSRNLFRTKSWDQNAGRSQESLSVASIKVNNYECDHQSITSITAKSGVMFLPGPPPLTMLFDGLFLFCASEHQLSLRLHWRLAKQKDRHDCWSK